VAADLTDVADPSRIERILRTNRKISILVNNAGTAAAGRLIETDLDRVDEMIALNVRALTRLTYAVTPALMARGAARSSTSAQFQALPRNF
jgi:hypothetical protein